jgi:hypothetical protein
MKTELFLISMDDNELVVGECDANGDSYKYLRISHEIDRDRVHLKVIEDVGFDVVTNITIVGYDRTMQNDGAETPNVVFATSWLPQNVVDVLSDINYHIPSDNITVEGCL